MAPQDPQHELQDSNGTVVGVIYVNASGELVLHNPTNSNEAVLKDDGTLDVPAVSADKTDISDIGAAVTKTGGDQTGIGGSFTAITFTDTLYEESDIVSVDLPNNELTIETSGRFLVDFHCLIESADGQLTQTRVSGSGTEYARDHALAGGGADDAVSATNVVDITSPPVTLEVQLQQDSGSGKAVRDDTENGAGIAFSVNKLG